jgi:methylation protein EvaC
VRRESCAACGGPLRDFLDLGSSPPADRFAAAPDEKEDWYPLQAAVCTSCWLAQLREVVPDGELYGDDYGFRTGSSPAAVAYFGETAHELTALHPDRAAQLTVEIGCNDGTLLDQMRKAAAMPVTALGVDPSAAVRDAAARGIPVLDEPFTAKLAEEIRELHGPAGLVLAFNVVAHVADPLDFLAGVHTLLADGGAAVIEFGDCEKLLAGCQYDHVYHEHRFFFALRSFARVTAAAGLTVTDWERTPAQGGSMRVTLRRGAHAWLPGSSPWLEAWEPYASLQGRALYAKRRLLDILDAEREQGRVTAGWGASAKSATLLNYCGLGPREVPWIEDLTPGKIGRYAPGSRIPVRAPGTRPDTYLLSSWNYAGTMVREEAGFLGLGGRLIIPGAVPVLLLAADGADRVGLHGEHRGAAAHLPPGVELGQRPEPGHDMVACQPLEPGQDVDRARCLPGARPGGHRVAGAAPVEDEDDLVPGTAVPVHRPPLPGQPGLAEDVAAAQAVPGAARPGRVRPEHDVVPVAVIPHVRGELVVRAGIAARFGVAHLQDPQRPQRGVPLAVSPPVPVPVVSELLDVDEHLDAPAAIRLARRRGPPAGAGDAEPVDRAVPRVDGLVDDVGVEPVAHRDGPVVVRAAGAVRGAGHAAGRGGRRGGDGGACQGEGYEDGRENLPHGGILARQPLLGWSREHVPDHRRDLAGRRGPGPEAGRGRA